MQATTTAVQKQYILRDRVETYKDFTFNLLYYINKYYIDKDSLYENSDIRDHFSWCYNKTCADFKLEGIDFSTNKVLKKYFYSYYYVQLYTTEKFNGQEDLPLANYEKFWRIIFDYSRMNNKTATGLLIEIYNIFDKTINEKKNSKTLVDIVI